jgi:hypothetical protein
VLLLVAIDPIPRRQRRDAEEIDAMNSDRRRVRQWRGIAGVVSTVLSLLLVEIAI